MMSRFQSAPVRTDAAPRSGRFTTRGALASAFLAGFLCAGIGGALVAPLLAQSGWGTPRFAGSPRAAPGVDGLADGWAEGLSWEIEPDTVRLWAESDEAAYLVLAEGDETYPWEDPDQVLRQAWDTEVMELPTEGLKSVFVYQLVPVLTLGKTTFRPCNDPDNPVPIICPTPRRPLPPPPPRTEARLLSRH